MIVQKIRREWNAEVADQDDQMKNAHQAPICVWRSFREHRPVGPIVDPSIDKPSIKNGRMVTWSLGRSSYNVVAACAVGWHCCTRRGNRETLAYSRLSSANSTFSHIDVDHLIAT